MKRSAGLMVAAVTACCVGALPLVGASGATILATDASDAWTVYHGDPAGSGVALSASSVTTSSRAWVSPALDGQLYGEPLVSAGEVFVATENDSVYALTASTGAIAWRTHIGSPVPASALPCGNISPSVGITGTPVIDELRGEIFVVAEELVNGRPVHRLVGLNTVTGATELTQSVDAAGSDPAAVLQRTGLTLDAGQVVFGMGGLYGDCGSYRGRVVAVNEAGGTASYFTVDAANGQRGGAIWMGGAAPVVDGGGNIWVTSGNGSVESSSGPYDDSDAALELSASLHLKQYFAPSTWPADNATDLDLAMAPALLPGNQVVVAGKSRIAFLLNGSMLGGIGGQEARLASICGDDIDGGSAVFATTIFVPCLSGPVAIRVTSSPPGLHLLWKADVGGGPPVIAAGLVWTIGQDGVLYGLDAATGAVRQEAPIGAPANHFPTPSDGGGLLLAPSSNRVVAFAALHASSGLGPTPTTTTSQPSATTTTTGRNETAAAGSSSGGASGAVLLGGIAAGVVAVAAVALTLRQRRRRNIP